MLQFNNGTVYTLATRITSRLLWRLNVSLTTNAATESVNPYVKLEQLKDATADLLQDKHYASFNDLKANLCSNITATHSVMTKIEKAKNVHDLLEVMKVPLLSHSDILKALEAITLWVNKNNKSETSVTENVETVPNPNPSTECIKEAVVSTEDDISQYSDLSTSEMIKEISKLASAKNRNVQLLNYFFQNILEYNEVLNAGECSSLMYSMSTLSYSDERLLKKICSDLLSPKNSYNIPKVTLTSIIKSMAFVRYKNKMFLNCMCYNIINTKSKYKNQQIATILLSFATLGYYSEHIHKIIELYEDTLTLKLLGPTDWLNLVWSYAVFRRLDPSQVMSVLDKNFIKSLMFLDSRKTLSNQLKLLNINGYAQYAINNYAGPFLDDDKLVPYVVNKRSKQKQSYVSALENTLKNMLPSSSYFNINVNTGMGFLLDAEICMNSDFKPIAVTDSMVQDKKVIKIAIMVIDYYDMCLGEPEYQGLIKLYNYLLTCKNYEVLCLSYQNFGIEDKIERRIGYLKRQIWNKFKKSF